MYKIQSIFYPELGVHVQFKTLDSYELKSFIEANEGFGHFEYAANVLKACIFNLETDVLMSIVSMDKEVASNCLRALYNGCIMLNPSLSGKSWVDISYSAVPDYELLDLEPNDPDEVDSPPSKFAKKMKEKMRGEPDPKKQRAFRIPAAKFANMERYLSEHVVGQPEAIREVVRALKLHHAGMQDKDRPIGVFLFAGPSGVGKTLLAQELHHYLFGSEYELVRIDCGEFQHKHENQKLLGSPPGYVAHEDGGLLKKIDENPNTVVLLDEVEKAHPDVLNTFLRAFDEGVISDNKNRSISFKNTIIVMTSNLGNDDVSHLIYGKSAGFNASIVGDHESKKLPARASVERITKEAMRKFFKPEFINRIDSTVIFNFLTEEDCHLIAELQLQNSEEKLGKLGFKLGWDEDVINKMVHLGFTAVSNARGMRNVRSKYIDELIADSILETGMKRGATITIKVIDDSFAVLVNG